MKIAIIGQKDFSSGRPSALTVLRTLAFTEILLEKGSS
jgi:hypothetical protein